MKNIILSLVVSLLLAPNIASAANPFIDIRDQLDQLNEAVSANTAAINQLRSIQVYVNGVRRGTMMEPRGGNAYLILAHAYIAAELNVLNGASIPPDVLDAWVMAGDLLVQYESEASIPKKSDDRALAIALAEILDTYNNGYIGPGHCNE